MTNQEAFDTMVRHLRKQGKRSQEVNRSTCRYYGPDGLMCAVGCLIPEDQYSRELEGLAVIEIQEKVPALYPISPDLLRSMQLIHDFDQVEDWEDEFAEAAKRFGLTLPPLEATHA